VIMAVRRGHDLWLSLLHRCMDQRGTSRRIAQGSTEWANREGHGDLAGSFILGGGLRKPQGGGSEILIGIGRKGVEGLWPKKLEGLTPVPMRFALDIHQAYIVITLYLQQGREGKSNESACRTNWKFQRD
jgi:hypothetical protein